MKERGAARAARDLLDQAVAERIFPAATAEVGDSAGVIWTAAVGAFTFDDEASPTRSDTVFDLASLTKPIVTTTLALSLMARNALTLDERVAAAFPEWRGEDRDGVTIQDLLEHASGLSARLVDPPPEGRREFEHEICTMRLEYLPRSRSVYSDLGFVLLGFLLEDRGGADLPTQFQQIVDALATRGSSAPLLSFAPPASQTAPTLPLDEDVRRGRVLQGEVHDNYAAVLGGAAGHAGLFGTAAGVGLFAQAVLRGARGNQTEPAPFTPHLIERTRTRSSVPGSSRALGWDTMLPTSSCGTEMSTAAFGHVGFTGTSLWIDPVLDRYFVLLTNRACGGGSLDEIRAVRRAFHNTLVHLD